MFTSNSEKQQNEHDDITAHPQSTSNINQSIWQIKEQRKKFKKKIFGEHYNYNYRKPNSNTVHRTHQHRNVQIQRQNKILLQKIQAIFKKPKLRAGGHSTSQMRSIDPQIDDQIQNKLSYQNNHESPNRPTNRNNIKLQKLPDSYNEKPSNSLNKNSYNLHNVSDQQTHNGKQSYIKLSPNYNLYELEYSKRTNRIKTEMDADQAGRYSQNRQPYNSHCIKFDPLLLKSSNNVISKSPNPEKQSSKIKESNNKQKGNKVRMSEPKLKRSVQQTRIMLFNGHRHISQILFACRILIHGKKYVIQAQPSQKMGEEIQKIQQNIILPYQQYRKIYVKYLQNDHANIFQYLWVSKLSGLLEFVGIHKQLIQSVEYETEKLYQQQPSQLKANKNHHHNLKINENTQTENGGSQKKCTDSKTNKKNTDKLNQNNKQVVLASQNINKQIDRQQQTEKLPDNFSISKNNKHQPQIIDKSDKKANNVIAQPDKNCQNQVTQNKTEINIKQIKSKQKASVSQNEQINTKNQHNNIIQKQHNKQDKQVKQQICQHEHLNHKEQPTHRQQPNTLSSKQVAVLNQPAQQTQVIPHSHSHQHSHQHEQAQYKQSREQHKQKHKQKHGKQVNKQQQQQQQQETDNKYEDHKSSVKQVQLAKQIQKEKYGQQQLKQQHQN